MRFLKTGLKPRHPLRWRIGPFQHPGSLPRRPIGHIFAVFRNYDGNSKDGGRNLPNCFRLGTTTDKTNRLRASAQRLQGLDPFPNTAEHPLYSSSCNVLLGEVLEADSMKRTTCIWEIRGSFSGPDPRKVDTSGVSYAAWVSVADVSAS